MKSKKLMAGLLMFLFVLICIMFLPIMFGTVMTTNMDGNLVATGKCVQGKYPLCVVSDVINREYDYYIPNSRASFEGLAFIGEEEKNRIENRLASIKDEDCRSEDGYVFPLAMRDEDPRVRNFMTRYFIRDYSCELCFSYSLDDRSMYRNGKLIPFRGQISTYKMNDGRYLLVVNCMNQ